MAAIAEWISPKPAAVSRAGPPSGARSPDTASPIYPERAIRPLPKSRLKAKLSPDQASHIVYPPDPPPASPALKLSQLHEGSPSAQVASRRPTNGDAAYGHFLHHQPHHHHDRAPPEHDHCTCGEDGDSGDEEVEFDHPDYRYAPSPSATSIAAANGLPSTRADHVQRRLTEAARLPAKPVPHASTASSADGYESFENTSNKKKRKIPLSTTNSMHQSQLSAEMASMGISGTSVDGAVDDVHGRGQQHYTTSPPSSAAGANARTGISGAGRGRYGRQSVKNDHNIRRPLGSSSMNANSHNPRLPPRNGSEVKNGADPGIENSHTGGIISQAIKTAAEQGPLTPQRGSERASLLQSATSTSGSTSANRQTQFTFAVESESANKMMDQQAGAAYGTPTPNARTVNGVAHGVKGGVMNNQGTQTAISPRGAPQPHANAARPPPATPVAGQHPQQQQQAAPKPRPRRRPSKEYALAARQRRLQQEYSNYHHPPSKENMWICEFCEYEDIFGVPPVALIRQYEIKDRAEQKRAAEKRRLLEKARAKGRKGKKGGKNSKNNAGHHANAGTAGTANGHGADGQAGYDDHLLPPDGEDYYDDDEYADEYDPVGPDDGHYPADYYPPPPAPVGTPQGVGTRGTAGGGVAKAAAR